MAQGFDQSQGIARKIAQMPSTTTPVINNHDKEIERHDLSIQIPYQVTKTERNLKQITNKMNGSYRWVVTSIHPQVGAQMILATCGTKRKPMTPERIESLYQDGSAVTIYCKDAGEYVTWIKRSVPQRKE